jgi:hypothetical protein
VSRLKVVVPPLLLGVIFIAAVIFIFSGTSIFPARLPLPQPARPTITPPSSATEAEGTGRAETPLPTRPAQPPRPRAEQGAPDEGVVATVNGRIISHELWREVTLLDRAVNELVGQPVPSVEETLDQLINEILILQAANLEGATVAEADIEKRIAALETAWKVGDEQVVAALQEVGLEREALVRRTGRLLLVEQGLATIAAEPGDLDAWLAQARSDAQIEMDKPPTP